jgi:AraC-like DNA-binding protein
MNLSHSQLYRKMVALTGQPVAQFIRTIRLNRAAELLANKTATVTEIAFDVGFNNLSYFSKCFRDQFGVLPSEYSNLNS